MEEVIEVPARQVGFTVVILEVLGLEELLAHHGEDEYDDGQHETQVAERAHRSSNDANQQVESRPRLG